jgi:hypothetical protein
LLILHSADQPRGCDDYDTIVSAEIPDINLYPAAHATSVKSMLHNKCGVQHPQAPCMVDGKCSKGYPEAYSDKTVSSLDGYPIYRRRNIVSENQNEGKFYGNCWVAPHNLFLCTKAVLRLKQ